MQYDFNQLITWLLPSSNCILDNRKALAIFIAVITAPIKMAKYCLWLWAILLQTFALGDYFIIKMPRMQERVYFTQCSYQFRFFWRFFMHEKWYTESNKHVFKYFPATLSHSKSFWFRENIDTFKNPFPNSWHSSPCNIWRAVQLILCFY